MYLAAYVLFIGIHLAGVGEALKVMFVITAIALAGLVVFAVSAIGSFDAALTDIAPTDAAGASSSCRSAISGSGRRCRSRSGSSWPSRESDGRRGGQGARTDVPKGIIAGMGVLLITAATVLFLVPGPAGRQR